MSEYREPTPEPVTLGGREFTRTKYSQTIRYQMRSEHTFLLETSSTHGQINGEWNTNKGIGYFLGIVNRQISETDPAEVNPESFSVVVRSTKSEEQPAVKNFGGHPIDIPFHEYGFTPPLTLDDLEEAGHYSHGASTPRLTFLRVDSPSMDYTYSAFNPERPATGAITTLDRDNMKDRMKIFAEFVNGTFAEPDFQNAEQILQDILKRDYPNALKPLNT